MSGLPAPPPSEDLEETDPNLLTNRVATESYHDETSPNQYQNEVLEKLNNPTDTANINIVYNEDEDEVKNGSHNNDNDDMKLSMECMQTGILPFGTFYEDLTFVSLSQYLHGIPTGLEGLKRRLIEQDGLNFEGIFRLRGKEINLQTAKEQLNSNKSVSLIEVTPIEIAQLIKAFYRSLPCDEPGYLPQSLLDAQSEDDIKQHFNLLSEPRKSLLLWTFDLWIKIEEYKPKNKMTLQSMAIVFSPNMVRSTNPNPMVFLELQKKVQRVIHDAAKLRKANNLISDPNYTQSQLDQNSIIPFKKDRNSSNEGASSQGPKYAQYTPNNNDNNGLAEFFKNCVIL
mmetsp:Transcript_75671/g.67881  ORF Transcript_75671/g.67881 Transcript_75671/m.67881 type:complete len:341 (-) Transcript_75671:103-1125(-)